MKKAVLKLLLLCTLTFLLKEQLLMRSALNNLGNFVTNDTFRAHRLEEGFLEELKEEKPEERGRSVGRYLLANELDKRNLLPGNMELLIEKYSPDYFDFCDAIWKDITYFPVPVSTVHKNYTVSYEDSWLWERTYGGKRGHEGVDIMAAKDTPGLYPVVSMTDGTITQMGWLEKGGWRVGILSPSGGYFYYAHLDSYSDIEVGDEIKAGDLIGFMGNSGYGPEGTTGMFATHLHVGIYLYPDGEEISINPYWILRMAEEKKLSCSF